MNHTSPGRAGTALILHGHVMPDARADEQDVLVERRVVSEVLAGMGYQPASVSLTLDLERASEEIRRIAPCFAFNLVESIGGIDRLLYLGTTLLDALGIPYTGCGTSAMFMTANKLIAKRLMRHAGLSTPPWTTCERAAKGEIGFPPPYIVKSVWDSASFGLVEVFDSIADLQNGLGIMKSRGTDAGDFFVEAYIEGREFNLSMMSERGAPRVLPPAEMLFIDYPPEKRRIVGYSAKWDPESFEYHHTVPRFDHCSADVGLVEDLEETAQCCWSLFELTGYARVDFRVDRRGVPWILEINVNPCLSPDSGFTAAAARAGLNIDTVIREIVSDALKRCAGGRETPEPGLTTVGSREQA